MDASEKRENLRWRRGRRRSKHPLNNRRHRPLFGLWASQAQLEIKNIRLACLPPEQMISDEDRRKNRIVLSSGYAGRLGRRLCANLLSVCKPNCKPTA